MRIEKTETVELLDWEKENNLEIVVSNWSEGLFRAILKGWTYENNISIISFGMDLNTALECLAGDLRGEIIKSSDSKLKYICPLLVHTKLVEPENDLDYKIRMAEDEIKTKDRINKLISHFPNVDTHKYTGTCTTDMQLIDSEPPIDAEGWEVLTHPNYYSSLIYNSASVFINEIQKLILISFPDSEVEILFKECFLYTKKANLKDNDSLKDKCLKIANYICSRLCDKIESN